ncbi:MAG: hypothetical protein M3Y87_09710 [Myxococcota bacterium]|nr:hypothetical protein [Myxococcota bacterium]
MNHFQHLSRRRPLSLGLLFCVLSAVGCSCDQGSASGADGGARDSAVVGLDAADAQLMPDDADTAPADGSVTPDRDAGPDIPVDLPGSIDGVEPEAHANHPPMIDGNGSLYRITESTQAEGNNPRMMRSTDSGATWAEADEGNRPGARDLEGCWQLQFGSEIYVSVAANRRVWFQIFHTSDAAERPDEWVFHEQVGPDLVNEGGVAQFSSLARTSDGQIWLFHSDSMISGRQQIGFRRRSASGVWSDERAIGETSGSWTGPRALLGEGDVTHVFYADHLADRLYWRTLSPSGELSSATRLDTSGTSSERLPHTNAVYYDHAGAEVLVVAFADDAGILRAITITDGEVGAEVAISPQPVLENPGIALNDGTVAHLAIDGTTVHALWVDLASGDVLHSARPHGGAWSAPVVAWDSGADGAWWVYGNVYRRGGRRRLGFTYDIDDHPDDEGHIEYDEITLGL